MVERAVYSLWTKPTEGEHVGFNTEQTLIECFALSLHYSKKWFKEVHLVTDLKGKALVEKWGLEFDNINTDFDFIMEGIDSEHWALGKIYACKIQDKPFIHLDIDVILFKPLPDTFLKSDTGFQNYEGSSYSRHYIDLLEMAKLAYLDRPVWLDVEMRHSYNCGVLLFNNLSFLNEWWKEAVRYVKWLSYTNQDTGNNITSLMFEQVFICNLCKHYDVKVDLLNYYGSDDQKKLEWVPDDIARSLGYTHLISNVKRKPEIEKKVRHKLIKEGIRLGSPIEGTQNP